MVLQRSLGIGSRRLRAFLFLLFFLLLGRSEAHSLHLDVEERLVEGKSDPRRT